ncbi:leucine-rich repeat-containing protein 56-like [Biomphalaria glabrata]|uniref:Leucine-rich repeat-containing protein 56-like n=1 Tax=Biomphalaria glabrata TaxID=6526 RepID=A0A9W3BLI4_BIOGL|nr:leucine-rich repeat-containing protein 56-like [Biomphalaria glabrata]
MAMVVECTPLSGYCEYTKKKFTMDAGYDECDSPINTSKGEDDGQSDRAVTSRNKRPMSALARGVQITEFDDNKVNPTPHFLEEADILLEQYLSPGKLQMLTGVDNLEQVRSLELKVNSCETSLGNFGSLLPNLTELKLSGSNIASVRDLGSSLRTLRVLWLTRCGLEELDGISSMLNLRELYMEYNEISDLSPLSMLEEIETLDLEGNNIDDLVQVQYLSLCPKLKNLALDGNPICACPSPNNEESPDYNYRETIMKILPNLLILDDEPVDGCDSAMIKHNVFDDDWAYLEELQKDAFLQEEFAKSDSPEELGAVGGERPATAALQPATSYRPGSALRPSSGFRPLSASKRPASMSGPATPRPTTAAAQRPVSSDAVESIEAASELTMGNVICGNPSKALRQRRNHGPGSKEEIRRGLNKLLQKGAAVNQKSSDETDPEKLEDEMASILEELQQWKVEHEKRMEAILKTKEAQVLVVDHDDPANSSDDEDDPDEFLTSKPYHTADLLLRSSKDVNSGGDTMERSPSKEEAGARASSYKKIDLTHVDSSERLWGSGGDLMTETDDADDDHFWSADQSYRNSSLLDSPSATPAQIINTLRSRQVESQSSPRHRKLRVGPTGLPLSSQSQQPVIRNSIAPPASRAGLISTARPLSSKTNLLPSQPRIPKVLPELQNFVPHPPNNS